MKRAYGGEQTFRTFGSLSYRKETYARQACELSGKRGRAGEHLSDPRSPSADASLHVCMRAVGKSICDYARRPPVRSPIEDAGPAPPEPLPCFRHTSGDGIAVGESASVVPRSVDAVSVCSDRLSVGPAVDVDGMRKKELAVAAALAIAGQADRGLPAREKNDGLARSQERRACARFRALPFDRIGQNDRFDAPTSRLGRRRLQRCLSWKSPSLAASYRLPTSPGATARRSGVRRRQRGAAP